MQLSKEEYARKGIHNGFSVQIENSVTPVTVRHHSASLVKPNSYPRDEIFNQHLTTIKYSYITFPADFESRAFTGDGDDLYFHTLLGKPCEAEQLPS